MTPGGMNKDFGPLTKFPAASKGKKATTLFLQPTPAAQVARKLPRSKVQSFCLHEVPVNCISVSGYEHPPVG